MTITKNIYFINQQAYTEISDTTEPRPRKLMLSFANRKWKPEDRLPAGMPVVCTTESLEILRFSSLLAGVGVATMVVRLLSLIWDVFRPDRVASDSLATAASSFLISRPMIQATTKRGRHKEKIKQIGIKEVSI
jgi:hypothetical protein